MTTAGSELFCKDLYCDDVYYQNLIGPGGIDPGDPQNLAAVLTQGNTAPAVGSTPNSFINMNQNKINHVSTLEGTTLDDMVVDFPNNQIRNIDTLQGANANELSIDFRAGTNSISAVKTIQFEQGSSSILDLDSLHLDALQLGWAGAAGSSGTFTRHIPELTATAVPATGTATHYTVDMGANTACYVKLVPNGPVATKHVVQVVFTTSTPFCSVASSNVITYNKLAKYQIWNNENVSGLQYISTPHRMCFPGEIPAPNPLNMPNNKFYVEVDMNDVDGLGTLVTNILVELIVLATS